MNPTLLREDLRYWRLDPHPRLRPDVLCYFVALPAACGPVAPACDAELLLPDGYSELVFSMSNSFERWSVEATGSRSLMRSSYVIGGRSHSVLTRAVGDLFIVGVKLEPHVLRRIIATPLSEFRDGTLPLTDLNQRSLLDLEDAIANAQSVARIAELLDHFFLQRLSALEPGDLHVAELQRHIRATSGALRIVDWVEEQGIDQRHLERRFCAWTGMTPKRYARIVRFKESYFRWSRTEKERGASGSHLDAYYDQSHFDRDFRYFVGVSPSIASRRMSSGVDITEHLIEGELQLRRPVTRRGV